MLILNKSRPAAERVALPGGASIMVRPATSVEVYRVAGRVQKLIAGLRDTADAQIIVAQLIGDDAAELVFEKPDWIPAVTEAFMRVQLALACAEGWDGVCAEDGTALPLDEANMVALLRDADVADAVHAVVGRALHRTAAEKKELPPSPDGAGAADANTAPIAGSSVPPAPPADVARPASAVLN